MPGPTDTAPPTARKRWLPRPRFSLRTLVILVLLIGCGIGLYWRCRKWKPWEMVLTVPCPIPSLIGSKAWRPVAFTPDGNRLIASSGAGAAIVWDIAGGTRISELHGNINDVWCVDVSSDGKRIATASNDDSVYLWDETGSKVSVLTEHGGTVYVVKFSPNGKKLLVGSCASIAKLYDSATGTELLKRKCSGSVDSSDYSPDGKYVVSSGSSYDSEIWDSSTGQLHALLSGHTHMCQYAAYAPDGSTVLTFSQDGTVRLWDADTGSQKAMLTPSKSGVAQIVSAAFSPKGESVITGTSFEGVAIWNSSSGILLRNFVLPSKKPVCVFRFGCYSPAGVAFIGGRNGEAMIVDPSNGDELANVATFAASEKLAQSPPAVAFATFSSDGSRLVIVRDDNNAQVWMRKHPEYWWGIAWLPEFWLTLLFAAALVWSIWRDRRMNSERSAG